MRVDNDWPASLPWATGAQACSRCAFGPSASAVDAPRESLDLAWDPCTCRGPFPQKKTDQTVSVLILGRNAACGLEEMFLCDRREREKHPTMPRNGDVLLPSGRVAWRPRLRDVRYWGGLILRHSCLRPRFCCPAVLLSAPPLIPLRLVLEQQSKHRSVGRSEEILLSPGTKLVGVETCRGWRER